MKTLLDNLAGRMLNYASIDVRRQQVRKHKQLMPAEVVIFV